MIEINFLHNGTEAFTDDRDTAPQVGENVDGFVVIAVRELGNNWFEADIKESN